MKTLPISIFSSFLLLASCNVKSDSGFPFSVLPKEGTGIIKNKEYKMSFDEIRVAQSINAEIVKASEEKIVVTAPSDILDDVLVENNGGQLYIHFKPNLNISARNVAVKIFAKDFSAIKASSSAKIIIKDQFTQDKTDIEVSSSASIKGNLEANDLSLKASSSSSYSGKLWAVNFDGKVSSSAYVTISGKAKNANIAASSSGSFNAKEMITENADISASSSGSVDLSVSQQLKAKASSSGAINIVRKGSLNVVSKNESSGGSINIR